MLRTKSIAQKTCLANRFDQNRVMSNFREGNTAVGTGGNCPRAFRTVVVSHVEHQCAVVQFDYLAFVDFWTDNTPDIPCFAVVVADNYV